MRPFLDVFAALVVSMLIVGTVLLGVWSAPDTPKARSAQTKPPTDKKIYPPYAEPLFEEPVSAGPRGVPRDVLATAEVKAAPWAPGLALRGTKLDVDWQKSRARIEAAKSEETQSEIRSYAIGDLLPWGSLLVGISTASVDVLVSDVELIRMDLAGEILSLADFRAAYEARPLPKAEELAPDYREAVRDALIALEGNDPQVVQQYIDELIGCGDPVIELLIPSVGSVLPVASVEYSFGDRTMKPKMVGDIVIGILEQITGQTFGEPSRTTHARRAEIADAWLRWWGIE